MVLPAIANSQYLSQQNNKPSTSQPSTKTHENSIAQPSPSLVPASPKSPGSASSSRQESGSIEKPSAAQPPPPSSNSTSTDVVGDSSGAPLSTPPNTSPTPSDPTNHWWDLWSYSAASAPFNGQFVAGSNNINGYSGGDEILILPMNIALGSTTYLNWFQFDIEYYCGSNLFGCSNGVDWYIWNIVSPSGLSSCTPSGSIFNNYDIASSPPGPGGGVIASSGGGGLSYNPGDSYTWSLYQAVDGGAVFYVEDTSNGNFWWVEFSVSSFTEVTNGACFSPVSGLEGYTSSSDSSFSQVNFFQFNLEQSGVPPATESFQGSGEPGGITTTTEQYDGSNPGGGDWYWVISPSGTLPNGIITSFNAPSTIDLGQTADITFTATNVGAAQAVTETMSLSIPGASASDLSVVSTDLDSANVNSPGSKFPGCYDLCTVTLSYPLVEGQSDNWNPGVTHTLTVSFTPTVAGTYSIYYKTVATDGYTYYPLEWSPDSSVSSQQDQQNEWDYVATITVTVPVSITLLNDFTSNPISGANYFTADYVSGGQHYTAYFTGSSTLTLHVDGGSHIVISGTSSASNDKEKWCFTSSCDEIDIPVSVPLTLSYYYFDLLEQQVSANLVGGSGTIPLFYVTAPPLLYVSDAPLSTQASLTSTPQTLYMLRGTQASLYACTPFTTSGSGIAPLILCDSDTWNILPGTPTTYTITKSDQIPSTVTYYQQYEQELLFTTSDGSIPPSSPTFTSTQFGEPYSITLSMTAPVDVWLDADAPYSITPNPLTGSTSTEQWIGSTLLLSNILFEPLLPFNVYAEYDHQFLVTFAETGLDSTAGTNTILSIQPSGSIIPSQFSYSDFPVSDWIDAGSLVNYVYSSPVPTSSSETQFALQSIDGMASGFTVTGSGSVTGNFLSQETSVATCAGTSPIDVCTGIPSQDGSLTAISTVTGVSVYITGTSAIGTVTITTSNDGDSPPATGADINLGAAGYYDVEVSGASDGAALVCITVPIIVGAVIEFTMQYWNGVSWVPATNIVMMGNVLCGDVPVSALVGTSLAAGPPVGTAPCSSLTSSSDGCSGIPKDGTLTAASLDTNVIVTIEGTSAAGLVTITITNYGTVPPPVGPDETLSGPSYYDVQVAGASDGTASVCIANPFNTIMHYFYGGSWESANDVQVSGGTICGDIPVPALTGTPISIGNTTPSSSVPEFPVAGLSLLMLIGLPLILTVRRKINNASA